MSEPTAADRTIRPSVAMKLIGKAFDKKRPVFLWGPPGIGKSEIIEQIGIAQGRPVIDIRLLLMDPTDIRGIPYYNPDSKRMEWAPPTDLPLDPDSNAIIFLDEMNAAPQSVQAAAYQLILNRRVGTYVLPENCVIVAAGNRESDKAVTYTMPSALRNRFIHFEMEVNFDDWQKWAIRNDIHPHVLGFLSCKNDSLFAFNPKTSSRAFETPRSWTFLSGMLDDDLTKTETTDIACGTVGEASGLQFIAYRERAAQLPNSQDILDGRVKTIEAKVDILYSLSTSLCYRLKKNLDAAEKTGDFGKWFSEADNFLAFVDANFHEDELIVLAARIALATYELPFEPEHMKNWDWFSEKHEDLILNA